MTHHQLTSYVIPKIDLDIVKAACVVTSLAIEKEASILSSIVNLVSSHAYMALRNVSHVSDIDSANGNDDILPISPSLYELVTSMEDGWTLALTDALSVGSDCACPDATIAESANFYMESEDCYISSIIPDLYSAPTSMEFQLLMDSKSPSSGHTSLVDLIGSSTLTPLLLHFVPLGSDNPSKSFEVYN